MTALDAEALHEDTALAVMSQVLTELIGLREEVRQMRKVLGLPSNGTMPKPTNDLDAFIMRTVAQIWRDQGRQPARTKTVARFMGYSEDWCRQLLKEAAGRGLIYLLPGRGQRISGKWAPISEAA